MLEASENEDLYKQEKLLIKPKFESNNLAVKFY